MSSQFGTKRFKTVAEAYVFYAHLVPHRYQRECSVLVAPREFGNKGADWFEIDPLSVVQQGAPWLMVVLYQEERARADRPNTHRFAKQEQKGECTLLGFMHSHHFVANFHKRESNAQTTCRVKFSMIFKSITRRQAHVHFDFGFFARQVAQRQHAINSVKAFEQAADALHEVSSKELLSKVDAHKTTEVNQLCDVNQDALAMYYMIWALAHPPLALSECTLEETQKMRHSFLLAHHKLYFARSVFCTFANSCHFPMSQDVAFFTRGELSMYTFEQDEEWVINCGILGANVQHTKQLGRLLHQYVNEWHSNLKMRGFLVLPLEMAHEMHLLDWHLCLVADRMVIAPQHFSVHIGARLFRKRISRQLEDISPQLSDDLTQRNAQKLLLFRAQQVLVNLFKPDSGSARYASEFAPDANQPAPDALSWGRFVSAAPPCVKLLLHRIESHSPQRRLKHKQRLHLSSLCAASGVECPALAAFVTKHARASYIEMNDSTFRTEFKSILKDYEFAYHRINATKSIAKAPSCGTMAACNQCAVHPSSSETRSERCCAQLDLQIQHLDGSPAINMYNPTWYVKKLDAAMQKSIARVTQITAKQPMKIEIERDEE